MQRDGQSARRALIMLRSVIMLFDDFVNFEIILIILTLTSVSFKCSHKFAWNCIENTQSVVIAASNHHLKIHWQTYTVYLTKYVIHPLPHFRQQLTANTTVKYET